MKKYSLLLILLAAFGISTKAQVVTTTPSVVVDGNGAVTIHYHPYEGTTSGDTSLRNADTVYVWTGVYEVPGTPGNWYGNPISSWGAVDGSANVRCTKVDSDDYAFNIPALHTFYSVGVDTTVDTIEIIFRSPDGNTQSATFSIPVWVPATIEASDTSGAALTVLMPTTMTDGDESVVMVYHPDNDTTTQGLPTPNGDLIFKTYPNTLYAYSYINTNPYLSNQFFMTAWGNVGTTPADSLVRVNNNNLAWAIPDLRAAYTPDGLTSAYGIDSIGVIFRTQVGDTQTITFWIPVTISNQGVVSVNANALMVHMYPNPATNSVGINYSFGNRAETTIRITNMLGQTVVTKDLGLQQAGNVNLSLQNVPAGTYLVSVSSGDNKIVRQLVKD